MLTESDYPESLDSKLFRDGVGNEARRKYHIRFGKKSGYPDCCIKYFTNGIYNGNLIVNRMKRGCLKYIGPGSIPDFDKDLYTWSSIFNGWFINGNLYVSGACCPEQYIRCDICHEKLLSQNIGCTVL